MTDPFKEIAQVLQDERKVGFWQSMLQSGALRESAPFVARCDRARWSEGDLSS